MHVASVERSGISRGKGFVMPIAKAQKNVATPGAANDKKESTSNSFEGSVVSLNGNKLVMKSKEGLTYSRTLADDAKVSRNGKACKAEDLKAGIQIRVTTKANDRNVATGIECLEKKSEPSTCCS